MNASDLLGDSLPPTYLPDTHPDIIARAELTAGHPLEQIATDHPDSSWIWGALAGRALDEGDVVAAYAYARTGYHRGLDALRQAGWRGRGPIPPGHLPNRGFLLALSQLAEAAHAIGEEDEAQRCRNFLRDCGVADGTDLTI